MSRTINKLSASEVRSLKPKSKVYRESDGGGLCLTVKPSGAKLWHFRYRDRNGRDTYKSFGAYPEVSLKEAREQRAKVRKAMAGGATPNEMRTFKDIALRWFDKKAPGWKNAKHRAQVLTSITEDMLPVIGNTPAHEVTTRDVMAIIEAVQARGAHETAARICQRIQSIYTLGILEHREQIQMNPASGLSEWVTTPKKKHFPALPPSELPRLMAALESMPSTPVTQIALELQLLTALRPGELRHGEWTEIDFSENTWTIPGDKMKAGRDHVVPLSDQAADALLRLHGMTGHGRYLFPGEGKQAVMSEGTVNMALKRAGFHGLHTAHGCRSTFSTWANEHPKFSSDWVEVQLAHVPENRVRAAYNRTEYLDQRRVMMQAWADHLDACRPSNANVTPIREAAS